jgi:hypothetical protein
MSARAQYHPSTRKRVGGKAEPMPLREKLARGWYALRPAAVDGQEISFEHAPPVRRAWAYNRADDALAALAAGRAEAA